MIDPAKEVKALSKILRNGFSSWQRGKSLDENPDEILKQQISDAKAFDKAQLKPPCDPRYDTNGVEESKAEGRQQA